MPVTFVPGRASVCMRPAATRSDDELNTIGISEVLLRIAAATCSMPTSRGRADFEAAFAQPGEKA
jgi:hypothetical protein